MRAGHPIPRPDDAGVAYIVLLFILFISFTLGMVFLLQASTETAAVMARGEALQAHYLAETAANHAMWRLLNEPTFPTSTTDYYAHAMAGGRYGYKVRRHTDTTFATVATFGVVGDHVVRQSYVLYVRKAFEVTEGALGIAYDEQAYSSDFQPRYRSRDLGGTWSDPLLASSLYTADGDWLELESNPTHDEVVMGNLMGSGRVSFVIWNTISWSNQIELSTSANAWGHTFDVAYEHGSGDALVVAQRWPDEVHYMIWDGASWSPPALGMTTPSPITEILLEAKPFDEEILMTVLMDNADLRLGRWNGSSFVDMGNIANNVASNYGPRMDIVYEKQSGDALICWAHNTNGKYMTWDGTTLSASIDIPDGGNLDRIVGASDPTSDRILLAGVNNDGTVLLALWNGTTFTESHTLSTLAEYDDYHNIDVAWSWTGAYALVTWVQNNSNVVAHYHWLSVDPLSGGVQGTGPDTGDDNTLLRLVPVYTTAEMILGVANNQKDLYTFDWDGAAWAGAGFQISTVLPDATTLPFDLTQLDVAGVGGLCSGLLGYWKLDETSGTNASDASGGGNDGTLIGMDPGTDWVSGQLEGGLDFDGTDDIVNLGSDPVFDDLFDGGGTAAAWIYPTGMGENGAGRILSKQDAVVGNHAGWEFSTWNSNKSLIFQRGFSGVIGTWQATTNSINLNTWHHVAVVYDGSSDANVPTFYIDGAPHAAVEIFSPPSGTPLSDAGMDLNLGNVDVDLSRTFEGVIDDARVYGKMLSAAEIAELHALTEGGCGGGAAACVDLEGYWKFDDAGGATASDSSDNGNDGTLMSMDTVNDWTTGQLAGGLQFNGGQDRVEVPHDASLTLTGAMTIACWVKLDALGSYFVVDKGSFFDSYYFAVDGTGRFSMGSGGGGWQITSNAGELSTGTWYYLAGTYDEATGQGFLYKNGMEVKWATPGGTIGNNTNQLVIGGAYGGGGFNLQGVLDDLQIYSRALTKFEIFDLHARTEGGCVAQGFGGANTAPTVDAGADASVAVALGQYDLDATVTDDGLPTPPAAVTTTWTIVSGPSGGSFENASDVDTRFYFTSAGTYVLQLLADDSELTASDQMTLTVMLGVNHRLLFVAENPLSLNAQETARKSLIDSWGYTVELIGSGESQTAFNTAFTNNDVVYVTGETTASSIGAKLSDTDLGVVNEHIGLHDRLGLAADWTSNAFDKISVTDITHFITDGFSTGWLTVLTASQPLTAFDVGLAPGLQTLAEVWVSGANYYDGLAVLETGDGLYGGGTAAGRRAQLPWGSEGFDFAFLNDDGKTIMRRAIEWAAGGGGGPIAHWKLDDAVGLTATDSAGSNHGTLTLGPAWVTGTCAGGLSFDGNDDYVDVSSMNPMSYDDFTISAWYKSADTSVSDDEYIYVHDFNFTDELTFGPTDDVMDKLRLGINRGGTWDPHYGTSDIVDQQWHHLVAVRASGRIKLYVDNVEESDQADANAGLTVTINGDGPFIGDYPGVTEQVHGILDDVRLYDFALTPAEVSDLFNDATCGGGGGGGGGVVFEEFTELGLGGNNTSLTISKPGGTAAGDLLIAAVATDGDRASTLAAPVDWNLIDVSTASANNSPTLGVWWKLAGASESANYTFTWTGNEQVYGFVMRFTGHDASTPINVFTAQDANSTSSAPPSPAVTTTVANAMILRIGGFDDDDITVDDPGLSGYTPVTMDKSANGNGTSSAGAGYVTQALAGDSGTSTFALTASEEWVTVTIGIAPAP